MYLAIEETLSADVRSKFQTKRAVSEAKKGDACSVPFDEVLFMLSSIHIHIHTYRY